jgi:hypothetical protein
MSSKAHANSKDKSPSGHQAVQPEAQSTALHDQPAVPARAIQKVQKARTASRLLTSHDLLQLQRTTGNQAVARLLAPQGGKAASNIVIQRVGRNEVVEIENYVPNCVDNGELSRKAYKRNDGIIRGADDTDLFYADGDGELVPVTVTMVNAYFDPLYEGFEKISGPDWRKNCEDYAKEYAGFGAKIDDYSNTGELTPLISNQGRYVLQLSYHWMSVDNTNGASVTIRQKDGESAVYQRTYDSVQNAAAYILSKRGAGGTVYATG